MRHLLRALRDPATADQALDQLCALGADAVEPLSELLHDGDPRVRERAAVGLGDLVPERMLALLEGEDQELADLAAWALRWPPKSWLAEPVLLRFLADPDPSRRLRGIRGLRFIGVDLTRMDPRILAAVDDESPAVRREARALIER